jgi:DNA-damage-inducible protein J
VGWIKEKQSLFCNLTYKVLKWKARKVVFEMAIKSSNVAARVEPEIKEEAEAILAQLGISASNGINMFYRQIILWRGLPFRPSVPASRPLSLDEMTKEEFDAKMARGLAQAKAGEGIPADDFFASLRQDVLQSYV